MSARDFIRFCDEIGFRLEPFQRKIARAALAPERELLVLLPRGNGKTTLMAAIAPSIRMLEWAVPEEADVSDAKVVKRANPASWVTIDGLREQREALPDIAYRRYHCNQFVARESTWLPPGAWQKCAGEVNFT